MELTELTKDTLIEGKIVPKGATLKIISEKEQSAEDKKQSQAVMDKFAKGELKTKDGKVVTDKGQAIAMSHAISKSDN